MAFNQTVSTATITLYLIISIGLGMLATRYTTTTNMEGFALADREVHWFTGFFSILASQISALAMLGFGAYYYLFGMSAYMAIVVGTTIFIGVALWMLGPKVWKIGRETGQITPGDTVREYYDSNVLGYIVTVGLLIALVPYLQLQFQGLGIILDLGTGGLVSHTQGVVVIASAIVLYTWLGGMKSVAWVDTLQGVMLFLGSFIGGLLLLFTVGNGPGPAFDKLASSTSGAFLQIPAAAGPYSNWVGIITFASIVMCGLVLAPHVWIRLHYFEDGSTLDNLPPVYTGIFWLTQIGVLAAVLTGVSVLPNFGPQNADIVIPLLYREFFPVVVFAIIMSAILAAVMSSASSQCHVIGVMVTRDIINPLRPNWSQRRQLVVARATMLVAVIIAALLAISQISLIITSGAIAGALTIAVAGPQLVGAVYTMEWPTRTGAILGSLAGGAYTLLSVAGLVPNPFGFFTGTFGVVVNMVVFVGVSVITSTTINEDLRSTWDEAKRTSYDELDKNYRANREGPVVDDD